MRSAVGSDLLSYRICCRVGSAVRANLLSSVGSDLLSDRICYQIESAVGSPVGSPVGSNLGSTVRIIFGSQIC